MRQASLTKREVAMYPIKNDENEELLKYILQYYQNKNNIIPKVVYVPAGIDRELLAQN